MRYLRKGEKDLKGLKELQMHELDNWLTNFTDSSGLDTKISILKRDISSKVIRLNELLNELESAKLKDEKIIPDRVKSIFEGNRKAFIDKTRAFIPELKIPENREDIDTFLESVSEKLNSLSEDTQKNYFVLKEFVEDHTRPIVAKIKDIDIMISNARGDFDKTNLSKVKEIRAHQKKYAFLLKEIESLNQELENTIKMKDSELERKSKFDSKLEQLKETKAYEDYKLLQERERILNQQILTHEKEIKSLFSNLEYLLKKRHNATQVALLEKYTSNPIDALIEDETFHILGEINYIKEHLAELVIKKDKRDSLLKILEDVSEDKIRNLKNKLLELREETESVTSRLKDNTYERSLKERGSWIESVNKNIEAIEKKQEDIEDLIERMNPKYVKQKIKDILKLIDNKVELK